MTFKDKLIFTFLSIFTLGIYPIVVFSKKNNKVSEQLSVTEKHSFNVKKLFTALGEKSNLVSVSNTHTRIIMDIKDSTLVDADELNKTKGISGVVVTSTKVTLIVGNSAKALAMDMKI